MAPASRVLGFEGSPLVHPPERLTEVDAGVKSWLRERPGNGPRSAEALTDWNGEVWADQRSLWRVGSVGVGLPVDGILGSTAANQFYHPPA